MEKTNLTSLISTLTRCEICFTQKTVIQYNLFEQAQPEDLAFNSYHSLSDYNKFLTVQYAAFKKEVDKQIDSGKDLNWILEAVREWNNKFYDARVNDKRVLLHDLIYLAAENTHTYQIDDIKLKVSGFLSAQKKNIERND